ncbi:hypothetical protein ACFQUU_15210 [Herbaspirillum sp. GCM10030257]|uniref:hypothetical protein n=1 Tax=Herbaspirillum sp. GCM10030257 TaxID=3273393 RepID=UPI00360DE029
MDLTGAGGGILAVPLLIFDASLGLFQALLMAAIGMLLAPAGLWIGGGSATAG